MYDNIFIILKFLPVTIVCCCEFLRENLHPPSLLHTIPCFMSLIPSMLCASVFKYYWYYAANMTRLTGKYPQISFLYKMETVLTNQD